MSLTKNSLLLLAVLAFIACHNGKPAKESTSLVNQPAKTIPAGYWENTRTDTSTVELKATSGEELWNELSFYAWLPYHDQLTGKPGSYKEHTSEHTNYSKEDHDRIWKESGGRIWLDTNDRNFAKFWYDDKGYLYRCEVKSFGDMMHREAFIAYNSDHSFASIEINDVATRQFRLKNTTLIFQNKNRVLRLEHNILKDPVEAPTGPN
jgi:hypothetical protein